MSEKTNYRPLRDAFGQFATGVTVVTALNDEGQPIGLTANSFASVSLEPALISWCVDKASTRYRELCAAEEFTISVLAEGQRHLSDLFAQRSWDDGVFDDVRWSKDARGVPQLTDVCARFHCTLESTFDVGDHTIIIGAVRAFDADAKPPLVFHQGDYQKLAKKSG